MTIFNWLSQLIIKKFKKEEISLWKAIIYNKETTLVAEWVS